MEHPESSGGGAHSDTTFRPVNWSKDLETVRGHFRDYRKWLADHVEPSVATGSRPPIGLDQLDEEIAGLPGVYGPPRGDVVLAEEHGALVALGALREFEPSVGEILRVYIRADHRGKAFGPRLTGALLDRAHELGYGRVRVYTMPTMSAAIEFYQEMGFKPIAPYWPHPVPGARFFEYDMARRDPKRGRTADSRAGRG
jgi:putative acetyltransferase